MRSTADRTLAKTTDRYRRIRRWLLRGSFGILTFGIILIAASNYYVVSANRDRMFDEISIVPARTVGLVLGTSQYRRGGGTNAHFANRVSAAAQLYHAGKVRHLLVSGDNRHSNYNEPVMLRKALVAQGVPAKDITCDFAGFRTLDSVIRAKEVFSLNECTIITQRYHNYRALEIARATGLNAVGFCAADPQFLELWKTELREMLARTVTILDLYVWHREPHFLGDREPIALSKS